MASRSAGLGVVAEAPLVTIVYSKPFKTFQAFNPDSAVETPHS
jgi:hypothetical protein